MRRGLAVAAMLLVAGLARAQSMWNPAEAHEVKQPISAMAPPDRHVILQQLKIEANQLRGETVRYRGATSFFVQGKQELCGATGNCKLWVFDPQHRQVLYAESAVQRYLPERHNGRYDIVTFLHDSAFEVYGTRWEYDGARYRAAACVTRQTADAAGNSLAVAKVAAVPCR